MKNILLYACSLLLAFTLYNQSFSMQTIDLTDRELDVLGNYYLTYIDATSNAEKVYALCRAFKESMPNSREYRILKRALTNNGFDPNSDDIDNFIVAYLTEHYRNHVFNFIMGPLATKIQFLKNLQTQSNDPFKQQAAQIVIEEIYGTEV